jgi:hypothetical protein
MFHRVEPKQSVTIHAAVAAELPFFDGLRREGASVLPRRRLPIVMRRQSARHLSIAK